MGLYYNPPMPNMGGQQPATAESGIPSSGPAPQNPPFMGGAQVRKEILINWIPPDPWVETEVPPIVMPQGAPLPPRSAWYRVQETITDWIPPQPSQTLFLLASKGIVASSNPPIIGRWGRGTEIAAAWIPPAPGPYHVAQPYAIRVMVPPISGEVGVNPPINGGASIPLAVLSSWIPPDPQPPVAILLDPPISSDMPVVGTSVPEGVTEAWNPPPPMSMDVIEPGNPQGVSTPVSPTLVPAAVLSVWSDPPPMAISTTIGRLPSSSDTPVIRPQPETTEWFAPPPPQQLRLRGAASTPPPGPPPVIGAKVPAPVLNAWIFPDPDAQSSRDIIPFRGPEPPHLKIITTEVLDSWLPADPQPIVGATIAARFSADVLPRARVADGILSSYLPDHPFIVRLPGAPAGVGGITGTSVPDAVNQQWANLPPTAIILESPIPPSADRPVIGSPLPQGLLISWLPPDPLPEVFINPPQGAAPPSTPPFVRSTVEGVVAGLPPQAQPYVASQPYGPEVLVPPISGPAPTNPPFNGGARVPQPVLLSWLFPPPDQQIVKLTPPSVAPALPPPVIGSQVPAPVLVSWIIPPPLPWLVISPPQFAAPPSQPPLVKGEAHVFADAWAPPPPMPMDVIEPGYPLTSSDSAPIGTKVPEGVAQAWTIPPPQPITPKPLTAASADRPPPPRQQTYPEAVVLPITLPKAVLSAPLPLPVVPLSIWNAWLAPEPPQQRKTIVLALPAPVINAPIPLSSQFWSLYASWLPHEPLPMYGAHVITLLQPSFILNPNLIATAAPRRMIATVVSNTMSKTNDLGPAIDSSVEQETVTFDFGLVLKPGAIITGIASITCVVYAGKDALASSRLIGSPQIGPSPGSFANTAAVYQLVGSMIGGVTYRLQCVVTTSDGQTLSAYTHLQCLTPL